MELRQLELFIAVAEEGHFNRAAVRCRVAQSALSTSIRSLERELGTPLLRRTTRTVSITEAGQIFLGEARRCVAAAASARAAVSSLRHLLSGSLRVGGIPTFDLLDQPALLGRMHTDHPDLNIRYARGTSTDLIDDVRHGRLDVAVVSLPDPPPADLTVVTIASGSILVACHAGHRLADRATVSVESLADESFVATPVGSRGRDQVNEIFARAGATPNVPYEVNDVAAMLDFVEHGLGVALVIEPIAASRGNLRMIPIVGAPLVWTVGVVAPAADQIMPAARALIDLIDPAALRPRVSIPSVAKAAKAAK